MSNAHRQAFIDELKATPFGGFPSQCKSFPAETLAFYKRHVLKLMEVFGLLLWAQHAHLSVVRFVLPRSCESLILYVVHWQEGPRMRTRVDNPRVVFPNLSSRG